MILIFSKGLWIQQSHTLLLCVYISRGQFEAVYFKPKLGIFHKKITRKKKKKDHVRWDVCEVIYNRNKYPVRFCGVFLN